MLRVIAKTRTYHHLGESWDEMTQYLQKRILFIWVTIAKEEVPSHAWITKGALGSTDWKSSFRDIEGVKFH